MLGPVHPDECLSQVLPWPPRAWHSGGGGSPATFRPPRNWTEQNPGGKLMTNNFRWLEMHSFYLLSSLARQLLSRLSSKLFFNESESWVSNYGPMRLPPAVCILKIGLLKAPHKQKAKETRGFFLLAINALARLSDAMPHYAFLLGSKISKQIELGSKFWGP